MILDGLRLTNFHDSTKETGVLPVPFHRRRASLVIGSILHSRTRSGVFSFIVCGSRRCAFLGCILGKTADGINEKRSFGRTVWAVTAVTWCKNSAVW